MFAHLRAWHSQSLRNSLEIRRAPSTRCIPSFLRWKSTRPTSRDITNSNVIVSSALSSIKQWVEKSKRRPSSSNQRIIDIGQNTCCHWRRDRSPVNCNSTAFVEDLEAVALGCNVWIGTTIGVVKTFVQGADGGEVEGYCEGLWKLMLAVCMFKLHQGRLLT